MRQIISFERAYNSPNLTIRKLARQRYLLLMTLPAFVIFAYMPMYGVLIALKNFSISRGVWGSPWAGLKWFRLMRNTLLPGFPAPIILALLLNEIRANSLKRVVQTFSYLPPFISTVIIGGMLKEFASLSGLFNNVLARIGADPILFFSEAVKKIKRAHLGSYPFGGGVGTGPGMNIPTYLFQLNKTYQGIYYNGNEYVFGPVADKQRFKATLEDLIDPEWLSADRDQQRRKMVDGTYYGSDGKARRVEEIDSITGCLHRDHKRWRQPLFST